MAVLNGTIMEITMHTAATAAADFRAWTEEPAARRDRARIRARIGGPARLAQGLAQPAIPAIEPSMPGVGRVLRAVDRTLPTG